MKVDKILIGIYVVGAIVGFVMAMNAYENITSHIIGKIISSFFVVGTELTKTNHHE